LGWGLTTSFALRILPTFAALDPSLLVASWQDIRLMSLGQTVGTYDAAGENCWFALNLDPDGDGLTGRGKAENPGGAWVFWW